MGIHPPPADWAERKPHGFERTWIILALMWCILMFIMMPLWHFRGKQNSTGEAYKVKPTEFAERVQRFIEQYKVGERKGVPVVKPPPGSDIYLQAQMWRWTPVLELQEGQQYRLHLSSLDVTHGFSLLPINLNVQVLPGYDHVLTITPTASGEYTVVCNEFCGIGHHEMVGKIIVNPASKGSKGGK